ncbi:MAG: acetyl-CoA carboxylase biotin carboxyl carrier protein [Actinomycetota bacterium]
MDKKKIDELIKILKNNDLSEVTVEEKGVKITVRRGDITIVEGGTAPAVGLSSPPAMDIPGHAEDKELQKLEASYCKIDSPMVGTFYRSPSPDADFFVEEGDVFDKGQTLCVIEAMKLMNEIQAEEKGRIVKISAENGEAVEFGQPLFFYEPVT